MLLRKIERSKLCATFDDNRFARPARRIYNRLFSHLDSASVAHTHLHTSTPTQKKPGGSIGANPARYCRWKEINHIERNLVISLRAGVYQYIYTVPYATRDRAFGTVVNCVPVVDTARRVSPATVIALHNSLIERLRSRAFSTLAETDNPVASNAHLIVLHNTMEVVLIAADH